MEYHFYIIMKLPEYTIFDFNNPDLKENQLDFLCTSVNLSEPPTSLSSFEKLKIRILHDMLILYQRFPTLHSLYFAISPKKITVSYAQLGYTDSKSMMQTAFYQQGHVNLAGHTQNFSNERRDLAIIPEFSGQFISYNEVKSVIQQQYQYLQHVSLLAEECQDLNATLWQLYKFGACGDKNYQFKHTTELFLGSSILRQYQHEYLEKTLPLKDPTGKKIKL